MKSVTGFTEFQPAYKHATVANIRRKNFIKKEITHHKTFEEFYDNKKTID
jgi:hypothetical protein